MAPISGKQALLEGLMIGRWMSLSHSSVCCIQSEGDGQVKTNSAWNPPKRGCLMLDPSTMSWFVMMAFSSLGREFGILRFL